MLWHKRQLVSCPEELSAALESHHQAMIASGSDQHHKAHGLPAPHLSQESTASVMEKKVQPHPENPESHGFKLRR
ncbi:hypothetical protein DNTS_012315 [Danionella cerebrum]|uniref:Uncharacterized protein n=1 Tax=Danionella cerebrum TaxID=2873325 RepID=A0A553REU7_9TELE|nr:hypothetical protein DNTS_012315 [Danionella translucida]